MKLNENVVNLLKKQMWQLAIYSDEPNAVPGAFKAMVEEMFKGAATAKGALIITPERVIVTTPGADNKKEL